MASIEVTPQAACDGCTSCCEDFALFEKTVEEVQRTHPGLLTVLGRVGNSRAIRVQCQAVVPRNGCGIHPSIIGEETRPSFCRSARPEYCSPGDLRRKWEEKTGIFRLKNGLAVFQLNMSHY